MISTMQMGSEKGKVYALSCFAHGIIKLLLLTCLGFVIGHAQSIEYTLPENLSQCDDDVLLIEVGNGSGSQADVTVSVTNPCGVFYLAGSVVNAVEDDIDDLSFPSFKVEDLDAGASVIIELTLHADCSFQECADMAEINLHEISAEVDGSENSVITDPYDIELPLIIVQALDNALLQGSSCETFTRTLTITNSRRGPVDYFEFLDLHPTSLDITSDDGSIITSSVDSLVLGFGPQDFMEVGDMDGLFEFNEQIVLEETITIKNCNSDSLNNISLLSTRWFCDDMQCTNPVPEQIAVVETLLNPEEGPVLDITPNPTVPACRCLDENYQFGMTIDNTSAFSSASNVHVELLSNDSLFTFTNSPALLISEEDTIELEPMFSDTTATIPCTGETNFRSFALDIPFLDKGKTFELLWWNNYCDVSNACGNNLTAFGEWDYIIAYEKDCANPDDSFHTAESTFTATSEIFNPLGSFIVTEDTFEDGTSAASSEVFFTGDSLYTFDGLMEVTIVYPCAITLDASDFEIGGLMPDNLSTEVTDDITIIDFSYMLPMAVGDSSINLDFSFTCGNECGIPFCPTNFITSCQDVCNFSGPDDFDISIRAALVQNQTCPDDCRPCTAQSISIAPMCDPESCDEIVPAYSVINSFETMRTNLGEADNDNDSFPDATGDLDLSLARQDRALSGDTILTTLAASVIVDDPNADVDFGFIQIQRGASIEYVKEESLVAETGSFINKINGLQVLGNQLRIFDASTGFTHIANDLEELAGFAVANELFFEISPDYLRDEGFFLPADYVYEDGDSIFFEVTERVGYNVGNGEGNIPLSTLIHQPRVIMSETSFNDETDYLDCACIPPSVIQISAFEHETRISRLTLPICEEGTAESQRQFVFRTHQLDGGEQFFPFEHRNLYRVVFNGEPVYEGGALISSDVTIFNSGSQISGTLAPVDTMDLSSVPFEQLPLPPAFEWAQYNLSNEYIGTECKAPFTENYEHVFDLFFAPSLEPFIDPTEFQTTAVVRSAAPELLFNASNCGISSFDDQLFWQIELVNKNFSGCDDTDHISPNTFFSVASPNGLIEDFELVDVDTGDPIELLGDVFQLGTMVTCDTLTLGLSATNLSCNVEELFFTYGWDCEPHTNSLATTCFSETITCSAFSAPGLLDSDAPEDPLVAPLCEETPLTEIEINNVGTGSVYTLMVDAQLPIGATVVDNSAQITFPPDSGNVISIADPVDLGEALFQFTIEDDLFDNGLDGVNSLPDNSFQLGYQIETGCDMQSGAFVIYTTSAEQVCGNPTNIISEVGPQVFINGAGSGNSNSVSVSATEIDSCEDNTVINLSSSSSEVYVEEDQISVQLPVGLSYVAGTCSGSLSDCEPTINGTNWTWDLTAGENEFDLEFEVEGLTNLNCGQFNIPFYTVSSMEAICASTGMSCGFLVTTGTGFLSLNIDKPYFVFNSVEILASNDEEASVVVEWTNQGADSFGTINVDLFVDSNNNGIIDTGDELIATDLFTNNVLSGSPSSFTIDNIDITELDLCSLIVGTAPDNCLCAPDESPILLPINFPNFIDIGLCADESVTLELPDGISDNFFWSTEADLSCFDCPNPTYEVLNEGISPIIETVVLHHENPNTACNEEYTYTIITNPVPTIFSFDDVICANQTASLIATEGVSYIWNGPGIGNFEGQILEVSPNQTSTYNVSIIDAFGCMGQETVTVEVLDVPIADAGPDIEACFGQTVQLFAQDFDPNLDYFWSPAFAVNNPQIPNPTVTSESVTSFQLTVSNGQCEAVDEVNINFSDELGIVDPEPIIFCEPQTILIELDDQFAYTWLPMDIITCQDANCSSVSFEATETTNFTVQVQSTFGCETVINVATVFSTEIIIENTNTGICAGESIEIFGETQTTSGVYCESSILPNGCPLNTCVTLDVQNDIQTSEFIGLCEGSTVSFGGQVISEPGEFCLDLQTVFGCDSTHCATISLSDFPLSLMSSATDVFEAQDVNLNAVGNFVEYSWTPSDLLTCDDCPNPIATVNETTTFTVEAFDENGCSKEADITITVGEVCLINELRIPDAITDNGNGRNDRFRVANLPPESDLVDIRVFNRWGEKVFDENNNMGWDGSFRNEPAPAGVYMYMIIYDCGNGDEQFFKGDITVLR